MREIFLMTFTTEMEFFEQVRDSTVEVSSKEDSMAMDNLNGTMDPFIEAIIIWEFGKDKVNTLTEKVRAYQRECGKTESWTEKDFTYSHEDRLTDVFGRKGKSQW